MPQGGGGGGGGKVNWGDFSFGARAILDVLAEQRTADPPTEVGEEFGGAIHELNFTRPAEFRLGQEVKEWLQEELGLLGVTPPDDGVF